MLGDASERRNPDRGSYRLSAVSRLPIKTKSETITRRGRELNWPRGHLPDGPDQGYVSRRLYDVYVFSGILSPSQWRVTTPGYFFPPICASRCRWLPRRMFSKVWSIRSVTPAW